jgi:hypothetical protein
MKTSNFIYFKIYSCSQNDSFYLLHENGLVSFYTRQISSRKDDAESLVQEEFNSNQPIGEKFYKLEKNYNYNIPAQNDQIRLSKNIQVYGFCVCPITQRHFSVLLSDGRILKYELFKKKKFQKLANKNDQSKVERENLFLFDILNKNSSQQKDLKITLVSLLNSIPNSSYIVKTCPPLTKKNLKYWQPLIAIGCPNGYLHLFNLNQNKLVTKFQLFTYPVIGIEWCSIFMVITWTNNANSIDATTNSANLNSKQFLVKNEVILTDLRTGKYQI